MMITPLEHTVRYRETTRLSNPNETSKTVESKRRKTTVRLLTPMEGPPRQSLRCPDLGSKALTLTSSTLRADSTMLIEISADSFPSNENLGL